MAHIMKNAKRWFQEHPRSIVVYHWRFNEMPAASRENMSVPRNARVVGQRVIFSPHQSEMSLKTDDWTDTISPGGLLDIHDGNGRLIMTYGNVHGEG